MQPAQDDACFDADPTQTFLYEALAGLRRRPRTLPCKYFYDDRGSQLFNRICELDEYYPTRTELALTRTHIDDLADRVGPRARLVELGSGSGLKTRILLAGLADVAAYVPVEISAAELDRSLAALSRRFPELPVLPICADYTAPMELPTPPEGCARTVVYFPGSTIGNFTPPEARAFLGRIYRLTRPRGGLIIGVDLKKDVAILEAAYNDTEGVTAAFNLNLLARMNRELGANFDLDAFAHRAVYDEAHGRIEMHLVSRRPQMVRIGAETFFFEADEPIVTEYSYKFAPDEFRTLAEDAGFRAAHTWLDPHRWFSLWYLESSESA